MHVSIPFETMQLSISLHYPLSFNPYPLNMHFKQVGNIPSLYEQLFLSNAMHIPFSKKNKFSHLTHLPFSSYFRQFYSIFSSLKHVP